MNSFGRLFRISIYGESHGAELGILIDGCPAGLPLKEKDLEKDLSRRKSGMRGTTTRLEGDIPIIKSGVFKSRTTGAPILISFQNANINSRDYDSLKDIPRPGHADFTSHKKYGGYNDFRGGGHFSGRLTLGLVAAGVIAKKIIKPIKIEASISEIGGSKNIKEALDKAIKYKDSIGGIITCEAKNIPVGLGEPFFDSVESLISHMIFSIPAVKGIEFGSGFRAAKMTGSEHNDPIIDNQGTTETNHAGGINGGITNGNPLVFRIAIKPTSSISLPQKSINLSTGTTTQLIIKGRHDTCIALRVPVIVESATAIVLADLMLQEQKINRII
jgi:chorismate synthase